jgi:hypothetical protein
MLSRFMESCGRSEVFTRKSAKIKRQPQNMVETAGVETTRSQSEIFTLVHKAAVNIRDNAR